MDISDLNNHVNKVERPLKFNNITIKKMNEISMEQTGIRRLSNLKSI
jgi:hypothetical protein